MMTSSIKMRCRLFGIGTLLILCGLFSQPTFAQCDFIEDITGIVQGTPPVGDAANPVLYTHVYVLVDNQGNIFATGATPDFLAVPAGFYNLYAVNYKNTEAPAVLPLLAIGQSWFNVTTYGNDDVTNCLDYSTPYSSGCPIVVCNEMTICEIDDLNTTALGFNATDHTQTYCLVCNDIVIAMNTAGLFPLLTYPEVTPGANCQLFGLNYNTNDGNPLSVGSAWTTTTDAECASACLDFIGMNLILTPITQASGNGVSTTADWWSAPCLGAQPPVNGGSDFSVVVNNWCVPSYNPGPIAARPTTAEGDDLEMLITRHDRFACAGTMDLTQNTIFYTVECATGGPSTLDVLVSNAGAGITMIQAALYGPVNAGCPGFSGGTFVDCNDAGTGSISGTPMGNITLTTNGNPGEVYLVIVDTEGTEQFTISSTSILLATKIISFEGHKNDDDNILTWTVADEKNVAHYILEYSDNAMDFSHLTQVTAANNGSAIQNYSYTHLLPGTSSKYYRLKTVNHDGLAEYSSIVVLSRSDDNFGGISIYPNPTKGTFFVEFNIDFQTEISYDIKDIIGQSVKKGTAKVVVGLNKIELSLEDFPAASYIVELTMSGQRTQRKLIKQ